MFIILNLLSCWQGIKKHNILYLSSIENICCRIKTFSNILIHHPLIVFCIDRGSVAIFDLMAGKRRWHCNVWPCRAYRTHSSRHHHSISRTGDLIGWHSRSWLNGEQWGGAEFVFGWQANGCRCTMNAVNITSNESKFYNDCIDLIILPVIILIHEWLIVVTQSSTGTVSLSVSRRTLQDKAIIAWIVIIVDWLVINGIVLQRGFSRCRRQWLDMSITKLESKVISKWDMH